MGGTGAASVLGEELTFRVDQDLTGRVAALRSAYLNYNNLQIIMQSRTRCRRPRAWNLEVGGVAVGGQAPAGSGRVAVLVWTRVLIPQLQECTLEVYDDHGSEFEAIFLVIERLF